MIVIGNGFYQRVWCVKETSTLLQQHRGSLTRFIYPVFYHTISKEEAGELGRELCGFGGAVRRDDLTDVHLLLRTAQEVHRAVFAAGAARRPPPAAVLEQLIGEIRKLVTGYGNGAGNAVMLQDAVQKAKQLAQASLSAAEQQTIAPQPALEPAPHPVLLVPECA